MHIFSPYLYKRRGLKLFVAKLGIPVGSIGAFGLLMGLMESLTHHLKKFQQVPVLYNQPGPAIMVF